MGVLLRTTCDEKRPKMVKKIFITLSVVFSVIFLALCKASLVYGQTIQEPEDIIIQEIEEGEVVYYNAVDEDSYIRQCRLEFVSSNISFNTFETYCRWPTSSTWSLIKKVDLIYGNIFLEEWLILEIVSDNPGEATVISTFGNKWVTIIQRPTIVYIPLVEK